MTKKVSTPVARPVQLFKRNGPVPEDLVPVDAAQDYELVAASQTDQDLGTTGAIGDVLARIIITANTGTITIKDDTTVVAVIPAASAIVVWEFDMKSVLGAWNITTAAATSCTCVGQFT